MTATIGKPSNHKINEAARHLVAAEAILRGLPAEIRKDGHLGWVQINGRRVAVYCTTEQWSLTGDLVHPEADVVVFVRRSTVSDIAHEYFVAPRDVAVAALRDDMKQYLAKHGGQRPRTPGSDQQTLRAHIAETWRDRWDVLSGAL